MSIFLSSIILLTKYKDILLLFKNLSSVHDTTLTFPLFQYRTNKRFSTRTIVKILRNVLNINVSDDIISVISFVTRLINTLIQFLRSLFSLIDRGEKIYLLFYEHKMFRFEINCCSSLWDWKL